MNNNEQLLDKNTEVYDELFTNINKVVSNNTTVNTNSCNNTEEQLQEDNAILLDKILTNKSSNNEVNIKSENNNNKSLFNDNAVLCDKILKEIGKVLNTNNVITQQSCCGQVCNLTMGAYCAAEQLKLASDYLKTDSPDSDIFKEHAKVFNLLLDILQKKSNKLESDLNTNNEEELNIFLDKMEKRVE